ALGSLLRHIPEAFGSEYTGSKKYHLVVGRGSSDEVRSVLQRIASDGYLTDRSILRPCALTSVVAKMLTSWIEGLKEG
ncbi:MAG: hypothetical protein ACT443_09500, partial [Gemmatimonadota bacterium]